LYVLRFTFYVELGTQSPAYGFLRKT
jgi:hypothetical protein